MVLFFGVGGFEYVGDGNIVISVVGVGGSGIVNVGGDDDNLIIVVSFVGVGGSEYVDIVLSVVGVGKQRIFPSYISFELIFLSGFDFFEGPGTYL
jgi:hypothetical protein